AGIVALETRAISGHLHPFWKCPVAQSLGDQRARVQERSRAFGKVLTNMEGGVERDLGGAVKKSCRIESETNALQPLLHVPNVFIIITSTDADARYQRAACRTARCTGRGLCQLHLRTCIGWGIADAHRSRLNV